MKARTGARGWLTAALLIGFWAQVALAAAHPPLHFPFSHGHDEHAGEGHDPASCDLCEIVSQLRAQVAGALTICLALPDEVPAFISDLALAPTARPALRGPDARAPPVCPIT
jgi:hypothetical protein